MIKYRKYERCLSKGLLRAMTAAATFLAAPASDAGKASNSFLTVEGEGVSVAADGSVCVDAGASGPVTVTARPGWLVNGRESLTFPKATGAFRGLKVTSRLGEDSEHVHKFTCTMEDREHLEDIVLGATADHPDEIAMYALPATSAVVTASATSRIVKKGKHRTVTTWKPCDCGAVHDPPVEFGTREVVPDYYEWESEAAGKAVSSNVWSGPMSKGLDQEVSFAVVGRRHVCEECTCSNSVVAHVDVHELSVERPDYLGLDRTDAGLSNWAVTNATARIDPAPASATYNWTKCGKCRFVGTTNKPKVSYGIANSATASERFLAEDLKVTATASNADRRSASVTCTTNFTVVKVDIEVTDFLSKKLLDEDKEEMPGAFIPYAADWAFEETPSGEGDIPFGLSAQNKLVNVYVSYEPADLPEDEDWNVKFLEFVAPPDSLYLPASSANADQRWMEFVDWWHTRPSDWCMTFEGKKRLVLHGHEKSGSQRDREIRVTHPRSGAIDAVKYTVFHVDLDIDSDNDLSIENVDGFEDAIEEREPGKIISYDQSGIRPGQDYRVPLRLRAWGGEANAVVRLDSDSTAPRVAEVYTSETGTDKLDLPYCFPADSIPSLYVDGITNGTVTFTATLINPQGGVSADTPPPSVSDHELAEDKVAALVIQPISFAPGRGRHAGAWISDPCMDQRGNTNRAMKTANRFASVAKSVGFTFVDHAEWCVDWTDGYDDDPGDLTLERFKNMANCGIVLFKGHGGAGYNIPVLFEDTPQGRAAANAWCAGETGMVVREVSLDYGAFFGVSCNSSWYAANWQLYLDQGNTIVFWQSCRSAERSGATDSIEQSAGGRWRISWGPSAVADGTVNDNESSRAVRWTLEMMSKNPNARSAASALEVGRLFMYGTCKTGGNPWTTLCPGPIPDAGSFPKEVLTRNTPALGCIILDTFIDETWTPEELITTSCGEMVDGDIVPRWLLQEGCSRPFGLRFRILKRSGQAVEVTASHQRIRNCGVDYLGFQFIKSGIGEIDDGLWDLMSPGRDLDADGVAPNNSDLKWRY